MNNDAIYDQFSENYDRFVNWEARLKNELPFLIKQLNDERKGSQTSNHVLDVACGTGQHLIALQKHGFSCSGADISKKMVKIARINAQTAGFKIPFKQAGFGQLAFAFVDQKFNGLICLGNSLPHVLNEKLMLKTMNDFRSVLNPGGKIIIQNQNFDTIIKTRNRWMNPETYKEGESTWIFLRFYDFEPDGMLAFNIVILEDKKTGMFHQSIISTRLWPFNQLQLKRWLEGSGFEHINLYGNLQGAAFDSSVSPNLVVTAIAC